MITTDIRKHYDKPISNSKLFTLTIYNGKRMLNVLFTGNNIGLSRYKCLLYNKYTFDSSHLRLLKPPHTKG